MVWNVAEMSPEPPQGPKFGPLVRIRTILESGPKMVRIWAFSAKWSKNAPIQLFESKLQFLTQTCLAKQTTILDFK